MEKFQEAMNNEYGWKEANNMKWNSTKFHLIRYRPIHPIKDNI